MIKAIFIDWDKTLSVSRFWGHWAASAPQSYELIQKNLFGSSNEVSKAWMRGQFRAEQVIEQLALATSLEKNILLKELEFSCKNMQFIDQSLRETITKIRSGGTKVVIATDNMDTFPRWTVPALQLATLFDHILDSHKLGVLKQDTDKDGKSKFFHSYLASQGIKSNEAVLFDDNAPYVESFGIKYVQVTEDKTLAAVLDAYLH